MQKHQLWLENKIYAQHLQHLQQIRIKKSRGTTANYSCKKKKRDQFSAIVHDKNKDINKCNYDLNYKQNQTQNRNQNQRQENINNNHRVFAFLKQKNNNNNNQPLTKQKIEKNFNVQSNRFNISKKETNQRNINKPNNQNQNNDNQNINQELIQHEQQKYSYNQKNKILKDNNNQNIYFNNDNKQRNSSSTTFLRNSNNNKIQIKMMDKPFCLNLNKRQGLTTATIINPPLSSSSSNTIITLKQKNLLWQNFLIGKRIIQTQPVICKKKHDQDYNKHLELLKSRRKYDFINHFRQKKLKEYNKNKVKINDDIRVQTHSKKYILILSIKDIIINKRRPNIKNFQLNLSYISKQKQNRLQKQYTQNNLNIIINSNFNLNLRQSQRQFSDHISIDMLDDYFFYFNVSQKNIKNQMIAFVEIRELKGLQYMIVGAFSFEINNELKNQGIFNKNLELSKVGKCIGYVNIQSKIVKKGQILKFDLANQRNSNNFHYNNNKERQNDLQRKYKTQANIHYQQPNQLHQK